MREMDKVDYVGMNLMIKCPDNDCAIYRNTYKMYKGICQDISGCLLSSYGEYVLKREAEKLYAELREMYYTNHAIQEYKKGLNFEHCGID